MADFTSAGEYEEAFDPRLYLESYFHLGSGSIGDDLVYLTLQNFHKKFSSGEVSGQRVIDVGTAPSIYQLVSSCEAFDEIVATWHTQRELRELQKWLKGEPDAFDWSSVMTHVCKLEGD
ncbi:indolethylamine N-methyltransferase-like, partial [Gastrophryne carolinensis]